MARMTSGVSQGDLLIAHLESEGIHARLRRGDVPFCDAMRASGSAPCVHGLLWTVSGGATPHDGKGDGWLLEVDQGTDEGALQSSLEAFLEGWGLVQDGEHELLSMVVDECPPQRFVDYAARRLGLPALLVDQDNSCVAATGAEGMGVRVDQAVGLIEGNLGLESSLAYPMRFSGPSDLSCVLGRIFVRSGITYSLAIVESVRKVSQAEYVFVHHLCQVLRHILAPRIRGSLMDTESSLVADVLSGNALIPSAINERARRLGVDFSRPRRLLLATFGVPSSLEDAILLAHEVRSSFGRSPSIVGTHVVLLIFENEVEVASSLAIHLAAGGRDARCAVSAPLCECSEVSHAHAQCRTCLRYGALAGENALLVHESFARYGVLETAVGDADASPLASGLADRAVAFDEANGTEYARTLYSLLRNGRRTDLVARELRVHRNTVFYRLERAQRSLGFTLDDPAQTGDLRLAFDLLVCGARMRSGDEFARVVRLLGWG